MGESSWSSVSNLDQNHADITLDESMVQRNLGGKKRRYTKPTDIKTKVLFLNKGSTGSSAYANSALENIFLKVILINEELKSDKRQESCFVI